MKPFANSTLRLLGPIFTILLVLVSTASIGYADLIGDTIEGAVEGGPGAYVVNPPMAVVIDPGIEFNIDFITTPAFSVDVSGSSVVVTQIFGAPISVGAGEHLVLSSLDWVDDNGEPIDGHIVGISNFQTNQDGIDASDVTFTDHSLDFTMSNNIWMPGNFASWDIETSHCLLGDVNTDGAVNLQDVSPFVDLLSNGVYQCEADCNQDGAVNLVDVQCFVDLLSGG